MLAVGDARVKLFGLPAAFDFSADWHAPIRIPATVNIKTKVKNLILAPLKNLIVVIIELSCFGGVHSISVVFGGRIRHYGANAELVNETAPVVRRVDKHDRTRQIKQQKRGVDGEGDFVAQALFEYPRGE